MNLKKTDIIVIIVLIMLLVSVRIFQEKLFYDPLLAFFKTENKYLPEYDSLKLFLGLFFRYFVNSVLSLAIIYFIFKDKAILKLTSVLYTCFFVLLVAAFFVVINFDDVNFLVLFYIRRFLIQPLFLILFVPAFYYQRKIA